MYQKERARETEKSNERVCLERRERGRERETNSEKVCLRVRVCRKRKEKERDRAKREDREKTLTKRLCFCGVRIIKNTE
jgi:hypothetical protein